KIDDDARPQPRSKTLMPGRRSSAEASHSVSHREFAPPLAFAKTHSGWYCDERENRSDMSRTSESMRSPQVVQKSVRQIVGCRVRGFCIPYGRQSPLAVPSGLARKTL